MLILDAPTNKTECARFGQVTKTSREGTGRETKTSIYGSAAFSDLLESPTRFIKYTIFVNAPLPMSSLLEYCLHRFTGGTILEPRLAQLHPRIGN